MFPPECNSTGARKRRRFGTNAPSRQGTLAVVTNPGKLLISTPHLPPRHDKAQLSILKHVLRVPCTWDQPFRLPAVIDGPVQVRQPKISRSSINLSAVRELGAGAPRVFPAGVVPVHPSQGRGSADRTSGDPRGNLDAKGSVQAGQGVHQSD